jgi:hypothetical protein
VHAHVGEEGGDIFKTPLQKEAAERDALLKTSMVKKCDAKRERWANGKEREEFLHITLCALVRNSSIMKAFWSIVGSIASR